MKVLIVGGVAGGASAAARLRRLDEEAQIVVFERGEYISYANCGLPYYIGGEITDKKSLTLQTPQSFKERFNIDVRTGCEVVSIDRAKRTVTVRVAAIGESYTEAYDKLLLSPGAEPLRPPIPGIEHERIFTLRTVPDTYRIRAFVEEARPRTAVVVGGGYIGVEMAENLTRAGLSVTVVELADHVIGPLDYDMASFVERYLASKGVRLLLQNGVKAFSPAPDGGVTVSLERGVLNADLVLLSIGVRPDGRLAKEAGLTVNPRGAIVVDPHMRTSDPDIYAVGDAVEITDFVTGAPGYIPLAGPANKQGRIAADNLAGIPSVYRGTQGSSVLKLFDMAVATTGLNERAAKAAGLDCDKVHIHGTSHAAYYPGARNLEMKVVFERGRGKILGAQLVGFDGVDKRCDVLATAIRAGMTAADLAELELCYAPPFSSAKDPVNIAGFVIENLLAGRVRQFHWDEVAALPRDGSVTLVDTRSPEEYAQGRIDGFKNVPIDGLRDHLDEFPRGKPVYLTCGTALRSYLACRILMQHGYECHNLSGGWTVYESVMGKVGYDFSPAHPCGVKIKTE